MKKKLLRYAALLLCAVLVLGLAACAEPEEPASESASTYTEVMDSIKHSADSTLADYVENVQTWGTADGGLWALGVRLDPEDSSSTNSLFVTMNTEGGDIAALPLTLPEAAFAADEGQTTVCSISSFAVTDDGTMYALVTDTLRKEEMGVAAQGYKYYVVLQQQVTLCSVDASGLLTPLARLQLPEAETAGACAAFSPAGRFFAAEDGTFWAAFSRTEYVADESMAEGLGGVCHFAADGSVLHWYELPGRCWNFVIPDGDTLLVTAATEDAAYTYSTEGDGTGITSQGMESQLFTDLAAEKPVVTELEKTFHAVVNTEGIHVDAQDTRIFFRDYLKGVYQYDLATGTETHLFAWSDYGIAAEKVRQLVVTGPDTFLVVCQDGWGGPYTFENIRVSETDPLQNADTVTIGVLSGVTTEDLRDAVTAYNFTEPEVYVQVVSYADGEQLEKDIINHTAPDIMLVSPNMNGSNYISKGLFLDLYPMLDADPEISREDLLPGVLAACEFDDMLPTVVLNFSVRTLVGDPDVVGREPGWTWQEFDALAAAHPAAVPIHRYGQIGVLNYLVQLGGDRYIDYPNNTARLDSPEFIRLLEASADYPAGFLTPVTDTKADMAAGRALLEMDLVQGFRGIWASEYTFDGPVVFKGFPTDTGSGSVIEADLRFGINAACEKPEAAWAFLRTLLMPQFQKNLRYGLPSNRQALAAKAAEAMDPTAPPIGSSIPMYLDYNNLTREQSEYFNQPATQAQVDQMMALIESADVLYERDAATFDIIREEAEYFYNGVRSAAEAAAIMQNRVQTYLDEQS